MEKDKNIKQKEISVPLDVLMDVSRILFETEMENRITGMNENRSVVQVTLSYQNDISYYQKAVENIDAILLEYRHYRLEEEDGDWREH